MSPTTATGSASRRLAIEAMVRIDRGGAYANLLVPELLERSDLAPADRHFVTDPESIVARFRPEFEKLVYALLPEPWEELRTPEEIAQSLEEELSVGTCRPMQKPRRKVDSPAETPSSAD